MRTDREESNHFVYLLTDPVSLLPFYIGQTNRPKNRIKEHIKEPDHSAKTHIIRAIQKSGEEPLVTLLEKCSAHEVDDLECRWIRLMVRRGIPLANIHMNESGLKVDVSKFGVNCMERETREDKKIAFSSLVELATDTKSTVISSLKKEIVTLKQEVNNYAPGRYDVASIKPRNRYFTDRQLNEISVMRSGGLSVQSIAKNMELRDGEVAYAFDRIDSEQSINEK